MKCMTVFFMMVSLTAGCLYTQQGSGKKFHSGVTVRNGNGGNGNASWGRLQPTNNTNDRNDLRTRVTVGSMPQKRDYPTWQANRDCWGWGPLLNTEVIDPQRQQEEEFRRWQEQVNEVRSRIVDRESEKDAYGNPCKKRDRKFEKSVERDHEGDRQKIKENERLIEDLNRWIHSLCVFGLPGYEKEVEQIKERIRSLRRINEQLERRLLGKEYIGD